MFRRIALCSAAVMVAAIHFAASAPAWAETAGAQAMARGDYVRAVKELTVAAKAGDRQAQYDLGLAYRDGKGTGRDLNQAYKWIRQAADKDLPEAQFEVGQMEEDGEGTDKNVADAAEWYRKAAQHGNVSAMYALGELYRNGEGVPKDEAQAVRWYRPAADKNDIDSQLALGKLYQQGVGVPKNLNDAAVWYRKAAQLGSPEGRYLLALLLMSGDPAYRIGHSPSRASVEAMDWLRAAADQGFAPAEYYLGMAHLAGVEAPLDGPAAMRWLLQAADQGHVEALYQLGRLYWQGTVVAQDLVRAYMYFDLAVEMGDEAARGEHDELGRVCPPAVLQQAKKRAQEWLQIRGM
jgi:TPR repeat protein